MGNESTAIHDLLSGLSRKAIPDDPDDDLLFAGSRREPATAPRLARGTDAPPVRAPGAVPTIHTAPAAPTIQLDIRAGHMVVPVPQSLVRPPMAARSHAASSYDELLATARVGKQAPAVASKKLYVAVAGLFVIAVVLLAAIVAGSVVAVSPDAGAPLTASATSPANPPLRTRVMVLVVFWPAVTGTAAGEALNAMDGVPAAVTVSVTVAVTLLTPVPAAETVMV